MDRQNGEEDVKSQKAPHPTTDGSLCGFDSLHQLLQASLTPQLFQVIIILSIGYFLYLYFFLKNSCKSALIAC